MAKSRRAVDEKGEYIGVMIFCPGCGCAHLFKPQWEFNGDYNKPTFHPSMLVRYPDGRACHSFVVNGAIEFLRDSYHSLAGKTVELGDM
jgi:hypothetical protein